MRRILILSTLVLALVALPAKTDDAKKDDLDPKVLEILKKVDALYRKMKSMHVESTVVSETENGNVKKQGKIHAVFDLQVPNLFAMKVSDSDKDGTAVELICDGTKLYIYDKVQKEYTEDSPLGIEDLGGKLAQYPPQVVGLLFQNVLRENPYDALMEGVTACSLAGTEKVNGTEANHLKFKQDNLDWELWVASSGKPVVLKAKASMDAGNGKVSWEETYKDYKIDGKIEKEVFAFKPPADAKKVEELGKSQ